MRCGAWRERGARLARGKTNLQPPPQYSTPVCAWSGALGCCTTQDRPVPPRQGARSTAVECCRCTLCRAMVRSAWLALVYACACRAHVPTHCHRACTIRGSMISASSGQGCIWSACATAATATAWPAMGQQPLQVDRNGSKAGLASTTSDKTRRSRPQQACINNMQPCATPVSTIGDKQTLAAPMLEIGGGAANATIHRQPSDRSSYAKLPCVLGSNAAPKASFC